MYDGFINAVKEVFGNKVKVVIDRFHIAKLYRNNFDDLRKKEMKKLKAELSDTEYKRLNNVMWILRKNVADQTEEEMNILKLLFMYSPVLEAGYVLRNKLTDIFNQKIRRYQARYKLNAWIRSVKKSGLTCFDKFIKTLENRMSEVLNYFIQRNSSGFVEGLNNNRTYALTRGEKSAPKGIPSKQFLDCIN